MSLTKIAQEVSQSMFDALADKPVEENAVLQSFNLLNEAAEIFDSIGYDKHSALVTSVLTKLAEDLNSEDEISYDVEVEEEAPKNSKNFLEIENFLTKSGYPAKIFKVTEQFSDSVSKFLLGYIGVNESHPLFGKNLVGGSYGSRHANDIVAMNLPNSDLWWFGIDSNQMHPAGVDFDGATSKDISDMVKDLEALAFNI